MVVPTVKNLDVYTKKIDIQTQLFVAETTVQNQR